MGLFDTILGRTKPVASNLDQLFALTSAAITLEVSAGLVTTGKAGVCFKPSEDQTGADVEAEIAAIMKADSTPIPAKMQSVDDEFGYRWLVVEDDQLSELVASIHLINSSLADKGFGPQLLCSAFSFTPTAGADSSAKPVTIVYLFKRGTFYPFCPTGTHERDNAYELAISAKVGSDLPKEQDLSRWMALWGNPVS
ncbi:MAG: hypothetical protein WCK25_04405 [Actinomycetes bacterium]